MCSRNCLVHLGMTLFPPGFKHSLAVESHSVFSQFERSFRWHTMGVCSLGLGVEGADLS